MLHYALHSFLRVPFVDERVVLVASRSDVFPIFILVYFCKTIFPKEKIPNLVLTLGVSCSPSVGMVNHEERFGRLDLIIDSVAGIVEEVEKMNNGRNDGAPRCKILS